jgi:hypothetical protein
VPSITCWQAAEPPGTAVLQSLIGARPSRMTPPHRPWVESVALPSTLARAVKTIGWVALPTALIREPRLITR